MRCQPLWAAAVFVLTASLYLPALDYPFQFDDQLHLRDGNLEAGHWEAFLWPPAPRVLTWFTFLWQRQWFGPDPAAFRGLNVVLHALNAVLVFFLLARLAAPRDDAGIRKRGWIYPTAAFIGALCFAWHPLQSEAVLLVYQRSTLLACTFAFAGLLIWDWTPFGERDTSILRAVGVGERDTSILRTVAVEGREVGERDRSVLRRSVLRTVAVAVCFLLAVAAKEFMVVFPMVLWFCDGLAREDWKPGWSVAVLLVLGGTITAGLLLVVEEGVRLGGPASLVYAATEVRVWWLYALLALGAIPQNVDHAVAPQTALDAAWWLSLLGLAVCGGIVWRFRRRFPKAALCVAVGVLFLLPTSSFVPSPDFMFEHRVYASMLGLAGLAALGLRFVLSRWPSRRLAALTVAGALVVLQGVAAFCRSQVWVDPVTLWRDAAVKSPGKYRPRYNYGAALSARDPEAAERELSEALAIDPSQPLAYRALGDLKFRRGDRRAARSFWEQARILDPSDWRTWSALGGVHLADRDYRLASERLGEAVRLAPQESEPRLRLSRLNLLFGFVKEAIEQAEAGLEWSPDSTELLLALAEAVSADQNWPKAEELFRRVLRIDPTKSPAHYGLARALFNLDRPGEALEAAREGRRLAATAAERQVGDDLIHRYAGQ